MLQHYSFLLTHHLHLLLPVPVKKPSAISQMLRTNGMFPLGSGTLNTWAMSAVNANNSQRFSWRNLQLPGTHCAAPSLIRSEKISGKMFWQVLPDFQLKMCGFSFCIWLANAAVEQTVFLQEVSMKLGPHRDNRRYQTEVQATWALWWELD